MTSPARELEAELTAFRKTCGELSQEPGDVGEIAGRLLAVGEAMSSLIIEVQETLSGLPNRS